MKLLKAAPRLKSKRCQLQMLQLQGGGRQVGPELQVRLLRSDREGASASAASSSRPCQLRACSLRQRLPDAGDLKCQIVRSCPALSALSLGGSRPPTPAEPLLRASSPRIWGIRRLSDN
jgi:hypothetical protein